MPGTPQLIVLTGLAVDGVEQVIGRFRAADPDVAVLHHDLTGIAEGVVRRRLRWRDRDETSALELAHGCVSCTLREDLLPTLRGLARPGGPSRIVLHLDPALEPEQVCFALRTVVVDGACVDTVTDLRGVLTVVDAGSWLDDATGDAAPADRGVTEMPDDERTLAQIAVAQAEFADVVVRTGSAADAWTLARTEAVLARLAPTARHRTLVGPRDPSVDAAILLDDLSPQAHRGVPVDTHDALLRGEPPLDPDCGIGLLVFSARRPFHPDRLHAAMDLLLDGVVRTRGRIWLATRPESVLWVESAGGGLQIGHSGRWLAAQDAEGWEAATPQRRAMAALSWDVRFGDRAQDLVVLTHAADPDEIEAWLREALLTDAEVAAGEQAWAGWHDPFGFRHTDPCEDLNTATDPAGRSRSPSEES